MPYDWGLISGISMPKASQIPAPASWRIDPMRLRDAALPIAAAWFTVRGSTISLPIEQAVYDLMVQSDDGIHRVQVKTTTTKSTGNGTVTVSRRPYSVGNLAPRMPYDPDVIDYFFIVDGDYDMYLIPSRVVAGRVAILLRTYRKYLVGNASGLLGAHADHEPPGVGRACLVGSTPHGPRCEGGDARLRGSAWCVVRIEGRGGGDGRRGDMAWRSGRGAGCHARGRAALGHAGRAADADRGHRA